MAVKCTEVIFTPISPLAIRLSGGTTCITPHKVDDKIVSLEMPNENIISLGDCLKIKKKPYKINIIENELKKQNIFYTLKIAERTKSSLFILPMLGGDRATFLYNNNFINAFIEDDEHQNSIILLYRWSSDPLFSKFQQDLKNSKNFITSYDPDPYHIVFVFDIPKEHKKNFKNFSNSKYSKMEDRFKIRILEFHDMDIKGVLAQILFKSEERRKTLEAKLDAEINPNSELLSAINLNEEKLQLNKYINYGKKTNKNQKI